MGRTGANMKMNSLEQINADINIEGDQMRTVETLDSIKIGHQDSGEIWKKGWYWGAPELPSCGHCNLRMSSSAMPSTPQLSWSPTKPNFIFMQQRYYTSGLLKALLLNVDADSCKYAPLTLWLFNLHSWHSETNPCSWCVAKIWVQHSKRPSGSTYSELTVCRLLSRIMGLTVPLYFSGLCKTTYFDSWGLMLPSRWDDICDTWASERWATH